MYNVVNYEPRLLTNSIANRAPTHLKASTQKPIEVEVEDDEEEDEVDPAEIEAALKAMDDIAKAKKEAKRQESEAAKAAAQQTLQENQAVPVQGDAAADKTGTKDYVPKVPTWGIFERPKDISKSYGGGRTIKAGASVSREEAEKRRLELQSLISKMKQGDGVTPAMMVAAQNNLTDADRFLEKQDYQSAEYLLRCIRRALSFRNRLAGRAALELGTILDAQGRYREAAELYKSLTKHPDGSVRKQAIRLSDSFEALRFFHYSNVSNDKTWSNSIKPLLRRFVTRSSEAVAYYHATAEDLALEKQTQQAAYMVIALLFLVPLGMVVFLSTVTY